MSFRLKPILRINPFIHEDHNGGFGLYICQRVSWTAHRKHSFKLGYSNLSISWASIVMLHHNTRSRYAQIWVTQLPIELRRRRFSRLNVFFSVLWAIGHLVCFHMQVCGWRCSKRQHTKVWLSRWAINDCAVIQLIWKKSMTNTNEVE